MPTDARPHDSTQAIAVRKPPAAQELTAPQLLPAFPALAAAAEPGPAAELSPTQTAALESLLSGTSITDAAAAAGVDRTTLHNWPRKNFVFQAALNRGRSAAWQKAVFAVYLAEGKVEPEVVENMRSWPHSGFHVDQSVFLPAEDRAGVERVMQYMVRCPFSLSRLVKVKGIDVRSSVPTRASQTWAMLIKRIYEVDPLACPHCGGQMKVVAFIEPPQEDVIERILRHSGLWQPSAPRPPPVRDAQVYDPDLDAESPSDEPHELTYVDMDTFWATY
jgi:hypothetical protein